jgi:hypothetical protein
MSRETDYTREEWTALTSAPALASMLVSMADLSGPIGLLQEAAAGFKAALGALDTPPSELVHALAESLKSGIKPDLANLPAERDARRAAMLDRCRQAAAIVAAKSPGEAASFKLWILRIATAAAESAKEGSFLGIGGTPVSDAETDLLRDLETALGDRA